MCEVTTPLVPSFTPRQVHPFLDTGQRADFRGTLSGGRPPSWGEHLLGRSRVILHRLEAAVLETQNHQTLDGRKTSLCLRTVFHPER